MTVISVDACPVDAGCRGVTQHEEGLCKSGPRQTETDSEELDAFLHSIVQDHLPPPTPPSPLLLEQTTKTGSRFFVYHFEKSFLL